MAASMENSILKFGRVFRLVTRIRRGFGFDTTYSSSKIIYRNVLRYFPRVNNILNKPGTSEDLQSKTKVISLFGFAGAARGLFFGKEKDYVSLNVKNAKIALMNGDIEEADFLFHVGLKAAESRYINGMMTEKEYIQAKTYIMDGLADIAMLKNEFENAEKLYKETMRGCLQNGMDKTDNAMIELSIKLATIYAMTDKFSLAEQGYEFAIETQETKLQNDPNSDPDTKGLLGLALESYGRYKLLHDEIDTGIEMLKKALNIAVVILGKGKPQTLIIMNDIASAYIMKKQYVAAEKLLHEIIVIAEDYNFDEVSAFYCNLGSLYLRMSRLSEAHNECTIAFRKAKRLKDSYSAKQALECLNKIKQAKQEKSDIEENL